MYDCIIVGSGPAGLMAANQLFKHKVSFLILEKNSEPGKKLKLTGGGRCNVTNNLSKRDFMNSIHVNQKFLYSSLSQFSTKEVLEFFDSKSIELVLDKDFKFFPKSNKSQDIIDALVSDIKNVIHYNQEVVTIQKENHFIITTNNRKEYHSKNVIIATGSKSFPKTGSSGDGLNFAKQFNILSKEFYPAETSLYSKEVSKNKDFLQGIQIEDSLISIPGTNIKVRGDLLFTHFGLSGPGIQSISEEVYHHIKHQKIINISLVKETEDQLRLLLENSSMKSKTLKQFYQQVTKKRVVMFLLQNKINKNITEISKKEKSKICHELVNFPITLDRVEDRENAYVNGGGVLVSELDPKTFESKKVKGLYFIGETVDVHGPIGGFNITIALSMGHTAANHIIDSRRDER